MARIMQHWSVLFALDYEKKNSFLSCYSDAKMIMNKLSDAKSVAVANDVFFKSFLVKSISCEELQMKAKTVLKDRYDARQDIEKGACSGQHW